MRTPSTSSAFDSIVALLAFVLLALCLVLPGCALPQRASQAQGTPTDARSSVVVYGSTGTTVTVTVDASGDVAGEAEQDQRAEASPDVEADANLEGVPR